MELLRFFLCPGKHKSLTLSTSRFPRPDANSSLHRLLYLWPPPITVEDHVILRKIMSGLLDGSEVHPIIAPIIEGWWILEHEVKSIRTLVFASYLFTWNNHHSSRIIPHHFTLYYVCIWVHFLKAKVFITAISILFGLRFAGIQWLCVWITADACNLSWRSHNRILLSLGRHRERQMFK